MIFSFNDEDSTSESNHFARENTQNSIEKPKNKTSAKRTKHKKTPILNENRISIVNIYNRNVSDIYINLNLNLKRSSIYNVIKNFKKTGNTVCCKRGGDTRTKLSIGQKNKIKDWMEEDASITLKKLKLNICKEYNLKVSISCINLCLKDFHYTLKSLVILPVSRNSDSTIEKRFEYANSFKKCF
jgi:transposase